MLEGGEDPLYVARRLVVVASEDVGLADSQGLPLVCGQSSPASKARPADTSDDRLWLVTKLVR